MRTPEIYVKIPHLLQDAVGIIIYYLFIYKKDLVPFTGSTAFLLNASSDYFLCSYQPSILLLPIFFVSLPS